MGKWQFGTPSHCAKIGLSSRIGYDRDKGFLNRKKSNIFNFLDKVCLKKSKVAEPSGDILNDLLQTLADCEQQLKTVDQEDPFQWEDLAP